MFDAVPFTGADDKPLVMSAGGESCRWARFILMYVISSFKEQTVDALATGAEEGRSNLR